MISSFAAMRAFTPSVTLFRYTMGVLPAQVRTPARRFHQNACCLMNAASNCNLCTKDTGQQQRGSPMSSDTSWAIFSSGGAATSATA